MRRRASALAAAAALALLVAGCGGGGGSSRATSEAITVSPLTKAEYLKKAEELCVRLRTKTSFEFQDAQRKAEKEHQNPRQQLDNAVKGIVAPSLEKKAEELRGLGAPKGDEAQIEAFLAAVSRSANVLEERSVSSYGELNEIIAPSARLAEEYGFEAC